MGVGLTARAAAKRGARHGMVAMLTLADLTKVSNGVFGIGASFCYWPGFSARAVDKTAPFISETGYRSFLGLHAEPIPGLTPDVFAARVIERHVAKALKGRFVAIAPRWVDSEP